MRCLAPCIESFKVDKKAVPFICPEAPDKVSHENSAPEGNESCLQAAAEHCVGRPVMDAPHWRFLLAMDRRDLVIS